MTLLVGQAGDDETIFLTGMQRVRNCDRKEVEENSCRFSEGYAVLLKIGFSLVVISLELGVHMRNIGNLGEVEND